MLELTEKDCRLSSANPRAELHGEDTELACDLHLIVILPNTSLDSFSKSLRKTLFRKATKAEADMVDEAESGDSEYLSEIRYPELGTFSWEYEMEDCEAIIHHPIKEDENINLEGCKFNKLKIKPMSGGSVTLWFRLICHPSTENMGRLCELIQSDVTLSLSCPSPKQKSLD